MKNGKTNFLAFQQNKYKKYFSVFLQGRSIESNFSKRKFGIFKCKRLIYAQVPPSQIIWLNWGIFSNLFTFFLLGEDKKPYKLDKRRVETKKREGHYIFISVIHRYEWGFWGNPIFEKYKYLFEYI